MLLFGIFGGGGDMTGYRFLRDGDTVQAGDEFRHPGRRPVWEKPGEHVIGMTYTRKFLRLTFRRPVPNAPVSGAASASAPVDCSAVRSSERKEQP